MSICHEYWCVQRQIDLIFIRNSEAINLFWFNVLYRGEPKSNHFLNPFFESAARALALSISLSLCSSKPFWIAKRETNRILNGAHKRMFSLRNSGRQCGYIHAVQPNGTLMMQLPLKMRPEWWISSSPIRNGTVIFRCCKIHICRLTYYIGFAILRVR